MNIVQKIFIDAESSRLRPFWRGQLFLFDKPQATSYTSQAGFRLLLVFLALEVITRPLLLASARGLTIAERTWWPLVQMTILCFLACWLVISFARVRLSQLGLYSWSQWSKTERFYFLQTIPLAIIVFSIVRAASLKTLWAQTNLGEIGIFILVPQFMWGFYQEFVYRGVLQTELVRRWGTLQGILASNLVFTFGPLHAYHFVAAQANPSYLWIFAAIFGIGLLFAILYERSGNLGLVAIMHGLGDWFIDGLAQVSRMAT